MASATAQSEPGVTEPDVARRTAGAGDRRGEGAGAPGPKTRGWEFTDLSKLDLASFGPAEGGDLASAEIVAARLQIPEGAAGLTQVDAVTDLDESLAAATATTTVARTVSP